MSRPVTSFRHDTWLIGFGELWRGVRGAAPFVCLFFFLLPQAGAQPSPAGGTQTPAGKEQQGWLEAQFQRYRSYPHLDRAYQLMKENKPGEARAEMERYLSLAPADRNARMNYLLLLLQMKDYPSAVREAGLMLQDKPEGVLYLYRGLAREKMNEIAQALDDYRRAAATPDTKPADRSFALDQAADLAIAIKKPDMALEALGALGPSSSPYRYHVRRGLALEMKKQLQAAGKAYNLAAGAAGSSEEAALAFEFEGGAWQEAGELANAREAFESALAITPALQSLSLLRSLGEVTFREKRYADAILYTRKALLLEDNAADRERLVYALRESGNLTQAEKELDTLLRNAGDTASNLRFYLLKSNLALAQNKVEAAQAALEWVLRHDPANAPALRTMAKIASDSRMLRESILWMERIPAVNRLQEDLEFLAALYLADGRPQSAVSVYRSLLASGYRKDSRYALLLQLGEAYKAAGQFDEAGKVFAEAVRLRADVPAVEALVQSLLRSGRSGQAIIEIDRVAQGRLSAEERAKVSILYVQSGSDDKALEQLSLALKGPLSPQAARQALSQRGFIHRRMGRLLEARDDFEAALRSGAGNGSLSIALGETCIALKDFDRAIVLLKDARTAGSDTHTRTLLAQAYEGAGDLKEALSLYEELLQEDSADFPQAFPLLASMGNLEARLGRPTAAADHYLQAFERSEAKDWKLLFSSMQSLVAAEQWETADSTCARLLALSSLPHASEGEIWETRGYVSLKLHKPEPASEFFKNAIAAGRDTWDAHQMLGLILYGLGRMQPALDSFLSSLQRRDSAQTLAYAGRCYRELERPNMALQFLQKALAGPDGLTDTERCEIQKEVGYLQFNSSDYSAAAKAWEKALQCQSDPILPVRLAKALRLAGHIDEAEEWLPPLPPETRSAALEAEYFEELANQLKGKAQVKDAIAALAKAQQLEPTPQREYQLGQWCRDINDPGQALDHLKRAVAQDGENAVYRSSLGYALLADRKDAEAAAQFEEAVRLAPDTLNLYKDLGYTYMRLSRNKEAVRNFLKAIEKEPLDPGHTSENAGDVRRELGLMRQEVSKLENRFDLTMYFAQSSVKRELLPAPPALALGAIPTSVGAELDFTPPGIGFRNERVFQVFGRVLGNLRPDTFQLDPNSYQAGAGARYKPLRSQNFFVSAEKIFGLRTSAADNWLLRGLYSRDWGYDLKPARGLWNYTLFYWDLGLFMKRPRFMIGYGELRQGISFNLRDTLVVTPHLIVDGRLYQLREIADPYLEGGGGVSFKFFLNHGEYKLRRATFELLMHYRAGRIFSADPILGNKQFSGFAGTGILSF